MAKDFVLIGRDPFARHDIIRDTEETSESCAWCGQTRPSGKLFRYGVQLDNGRTSWHRKLFCSASCRRTYGE